MNTRLVSLLLIICLTLVGCGSDEPEVLELKRLEISSSVGDLLNILSSEKTQLSVRGFDQNGDEFEVSGVMWAVNNENVTLEQNGTVTANKVGTSIITANAGEIEATYGMTVWDSSAPRIEIYVSDVGANRNGPHKIKKYWEDGSRPSDYITEQLARPQDIVFLEDQNIVLVSNLGSNNINRYDISSGAFINTFANGISQPTRIDIGPDELLYVLQWGGGPVKRYDLDGTFVDDFTKSSINEAIGMDWDEVGNLYVSSFNNGVNGFVLKFDTDGNQTETFISNGLSGPTDIWFDADGNLFVNDWSGNSVKKYDSNGTLIETFISSVSQPEGVDFLDNGDVLIGASGSSSIKRYGGNGTFISDLVPGGGGGLVTPNAVVLRRVNY